MNLYVINCLSWLNLINAESLFGSSYQLQLQLNLMTASVLKHILNNGFLKDVDVFKSSLLDHSIVTGSSATPADRR